MHRLSLKLIVTTLGQIHSIALMHMHMHGWYACVGLTDDVSGEIGCHHAWADSPVNVLSEVGFDGSVGSIS